MTRRQFEGFVNLEIAKRDGSRLEEESGGVSGADHPRAAGSDVVVRDYCWRPEVVARLGLRVLRDLPGAAFVGSALHRDPGRTGKEREIATAFLTLAPGEEPWAVFGVKGVEDPERDLTLCRAVVLLKWLAREDPEVLARLAEAEGKDAELVVEEETLFGAPVREVPFVAEGSETPVFGEP